MNPDKLPFPTPYDIVEFPTFAWEPTYLLWFLASALFIGSVAYHVLTKTKTKDTSNSVMWRSCKAELERILVRSIEEKDTRDSAAAASRSVRRLLEAHLQRPITSLSSQEIWALQTDETLPPTTRQIFSIVQKLDDWRFAPSVDPARIQHEIRALMSAIDTHRMD